MQKKRFNYPRPREDVPALLAHSVSDLPTVLLPLLEPASGDSPSLEKAKRCACSAYAAYTLFYCMLKCKGVNIKHHPIQNELRKVMSYVNKVKELEKKKKKDASRPKVRVNLDAFRRIMHRAIPPREKKIKIEKKSEQKEKEKGKEMEDQNSIGGMKRKRDEDDEGELPDMKKPKIGEE